MRLGLPSLQVGLGVGAFVLGTLAVAAGLLVPLTTSSADTRPAITLPLCATVPTPPTGSCTTRTPESQSSSGQSRSGTSLLDQGLDAQLLVAIAIVEVVLLAVAVSAVAHARTRARLLLVPLWIATLLITLGALAAGLSIGVFFMPAAALAVGAAITATARGGLTATPS
jgi:hypothetical protein